jgi:hypothetical protein
VAFVALVTVLLWWSAQHGLRVRLWLALERDHLALAALRQATSPEPIVQALTTRANPDLLEVLPLEELNLWPWAACAQGCPPFPNIDLAWWHMRGIEVDPVTLHTPPWVADRIIGHRVLLAAWPRLAVAVPDRPGTRGAWRNPVYWTGHPDYPIVALSAAYTTGSEVLRLDLQQRRGRVWRNLGMLQAYRLGHLGTWSGSGSTRHVDCWLCGPITGPATGVTEHEDGSLTWTRPDGTQVRVPPIAWLPEGWTRPPYPRPTMPPPDLSPR